MAKAEQQSPAANTGPAEQFGLLTEPKRRMGAREATLALLIGFGFASLVALTAMAYIVDQQRSSFANDVKKIERQLSDHLQLSTRTLHSLAAIHQAAETDNVARQFGIFAQGALQNNAFIKSIGRYDRIELEELGSFHKRLKEHGIVNTDELFIRQFGSDQISIGQTRFHAVVSVQPQSEETMALLGLDLTSLETLSKPLLAATSENRMRSTVAPASWSLEQPALVVVQPTYHGHYPPQHPIDRLDQTDGGYWLTADTFAMLSESLIETGSIVAELSMPVGDSADGPVILKNLGRDKRGGQALHFETLFSPLQHFSKLTIGSNQIELSLQRKTGLPASQIPLVLVPFSVSLLLASLVFFLRHLRLSNEIHRDLQQRALQRERERALVTLQSIRDGVITADSEGLITSVNPAANRILDGAGNSLLHSRLSEKLAFYPAKNNREPRGPGDAVPFKTNDVTHLNIARVSVHGDLLEDALVDLTLSPLTDDNEQHSGTVVAMRDISTEQKLERELSYLAVHDRLTKLANRAAFEQQLGELVADNQHSNTNQHSICYIDLDQFKLINDTCGHASGDLLLSRLARELTSLVREQDLLARLGGDEFGVLLRSCSPAQAEQLAQRLHEFFQQYFFTFEDKIFAVRASLGLVHINDSHTSINEVMSELDLACYQAKDSGRNTLHIYDAGAEVTQRRYGEMISLTVVQNALRDRRFTLFVQPIANVNEYVADKQSGINYHEILLRLIDQQGQPVSPFKFILAAERYDMIKDIDRWVIAEGLRKIANMPPEQQPRRHFSINLSGQSLADESILDYINEQIDLCRIDPTSLCFEITETSVISNFDHALALIARLRARGCRIALDDFGAGVSSFGYLRKLPIDYLKIDGQFIREMVNSPVDLEMVRSMTTVGKALGIKIVAEFVENAEIIEALDALDIDFAQGYHISQPFPIDDLLDHHQAADAA